MTIQAFEAWRASDRAPTAAAAAGPFAAFRWQALLTFFLQRIGLNQTVGGMLYPLPLTIFGMPVILGWMIAKGWAKPSPTRIILYCGLVMGGCISMLNSLHGGSALSMYMFFALYAFFLFPVVLDDAAYDRFFRIVVKIGVALSIIAVVQYAIQYVWSPPWLFSWRTLITPQFLIEYNTLNWTGAWGSGLYKGNGFFMMEASWMSQLAARTMLISIIMLRDPRWVVPCGMALLATYSGTGMVLFAIFGTIPLLGLMSKSKYLPWAIAGLVAVFLVLATFSKALNLDLFLGRLTEFNTPDSSASFRFIVVQEAYEKFLTEPILTLIFGAGPAAADYYLHGLRTDGFAPGWLKLICDYGFFGFTMFSAFLATCVYQTTRSWIIAAAVLFQYLVLDGSIVVPQSAFITLFIAGMVVRRSTFKPLGMMAAPGRFAGP